MRVPLRIVADGALHLFLGTYLLWLVSAALIPPLDVLASAPRESAPELGILETHHYTIARFQADVLLYVWERDVLRRNAIPGDRARRGFLMEMGEAASAAQRAASDFAWARDLHDPIRRESARLAYISAMEILRDNRIELELAVQQEVAAELVKAGLAGAGGLAVPVRFRLAVPPLVLTVSPRDEIRPLASYFLESGTPMSEIEEFENHARDVLNLSALAEGAGGVATYPATVHVRFGTLQNLFEIVAHEWFHNYLWLRPLGRRYLMSTSHRTLNETAATIVGEEISRRLMLRRFRDLYAPEPLDEVEEQMEDASAEIQSDEEEATLTFEFNRAMRETRLHVDDLLAAGRVEEAEAYMEERRLLFVALGFPIRKLNQAYFAFRGTYATEEASSSDIGPRMLELRSLSPNLGDFARTVAGLRNERDLDRVLDSSRRQAAASG